MLVDQHDDLAADGRAAIVELQVLALALVVGGRAVAVCEGEAVESYQIAAGVFDNAAGRATAHCKQEGAPSTCLIAILPLWVMLTEGRAFYYVGCLPAVYCAASEKVG